jgi:glucan 1,3-beta-glucosidase
VGASAGPPRFYGQSLETNMSRTSLASSNYNAYNTPYQGSEYGGSVTHLPVGRESTSQFASYRDDPAQPGAGVAMEPLGASRSPDQLTEKRAMYGAPDAKRKRSGKLICGIVAGALIVAAGVMVPLYFFVLKDRIHLGGSNSGTSPSSPTSTGKTSSGAPVTGGVGSTITLEDGSSFVYNNAFGGQWYADPLDPFNNAAKPNSWTPALNEPWKWGIDKVYGLVLLPCMLLCFAN